MSPRFVDMNADGYHDLVVCTYDGVVMFGFGTNEGFKTAERVLDQEGQPVAISKYYDWEKAEGKRTGWKYLMEGSKAHGTSVCPVDWDEDGDFDLLLGDSGKGGLFIRMNEGTAQEPKFAAESMPVTAGDAPVKIKSLVADTLVVDWNQDGRFDILLGGLSGGVYWLENKGEAGRPKFAAAKTLIEQVDKKLKPKRLVTVKTHNNLPVEPGTAMQLTAVDYDQDGRLDLLVGGRVLWNLDEVDGMTEDDKKAVARMEANLEKLAAEADEIYAKIPKADKAERAALTKQAGQRMADQRKVHRKIQNLTDKDKPRRRGDFVWFFKGK